MRMLSQLGTVTIEANNPGVQLVLPAGSVSASLRKPVHLVIKNTGAAAAYLCATSTEDGPTAAAIPVGATVTMEGYCSQNLPFFWAAAGNNCLVTAFVEVA